MTQVEIEGAERLSETLRHAATRIEKYPGENSEIARGIASMASAGAPRRWGTLAGSFRHVGTSTYALVSSYIYYAPFQEFGTRYIQERRFFRNAVSAVDPYYVYAVAIDRAMDSIKGK